MGQDNGTAGSIFMAFVLGAIAGAATALLLAPATGEETRKLLADKAREGGDKAREKATEASQRGKEFIDRQRDTIATAIDRGKQAYQQAKSTTEEHA